MEFTEAYQHELIRKMARKGFLDSFFNLLSADIFDPQLEDLVQEVLDRYERTKKAPSQAQLNQLITRHQVKLKPGECSNFEFDREELLSWRKYRTFRDGLARCHVLVEQGKFDRIDSTIRKCYDSLPLVAVAPDVLLSMKPMPVRKGLVKTGLKSLDEHLGGGVGAGDLAMIFAPTSGGKTSWLVFLATQAVQAGEKVFYATLEVPSTEIEGKLRRCLTRQSNPSKATWLKVSRAVQRKKARCNIAEFAPLSIGVNEMARHIPEDTTLVIVDYADYLRPVNRQPGLTYEDLGRIYNELKSLALERRIPVWTASQVNRGAYGDEVKKLEDIESSMKKAMVSDQGISINQTEGEQEPNEKSGLVSGVIYLAKNRHGPRHAKFDVSIHWETCWFEEGKWS